MAHIYLCPLDFLWADGLDKHVYPHILQLLESHSFNGHISHEAAKKSRVRRSASNGAGTHLREIRALVRELEGRDDTEEDELDNASQNPSYNNTPSQSVGTSPVFERHAFVPLRPRHESSNSPNGTQHNFIDGQQQQQQE